MKSGHLVSHEVFYLMRHGVAELMRHKVYEVCMSVQKGITLILWYT